VQKRSARAAELNPHWPGKDWTTNPAKDNTRGRYGGTIEVHDPNTAGIIRL